MPVNNKLHLKTRSSFPGKGVKKQSVVSVQMNLISIRVSCLSSSSSSSSSSSFSSSSSSSSSSFIHCHLWFKSVPHSLSIFYFLSYTDGTEGLPITVIVVSVTLISCAIIGLAVFIIYRKIALESELNDSWWRVKWEDIRFAEKQSGSKRSTTSLGTSQGTLSTLGGANTKVSGATSVASSMNTTCANISGVKVGLYKVCNLFLFYLLSNTKTLNVQNFLVSGVPWHLIGAQT